MGANPHIPLVIIQQGQASVLRKAVFNGEVFKPYMRARGEVCAAALGRNRLKGSQGQQDGQKKDEAAHQFLRLHSDFNQIAFWIQDQALIVAVSGHARPPDHRVTIGCQPLGQAIHPFARPH